MRRETARGERVKIALFGGSFDPPHAGHDAAVGAILSALKPDLLIIMPSFLNPFKKSFSAPPQLRLKWCRALWGDTPHVEVSDYEISQNVPVPTIQSVKFLLEKYGRNGKITSETAIETGKTLQSDTADQIPVGSESETGGISQSKVSKIPHDGTSEAGGAGDVSETQNIDKISNADEVSNVAASRMSGAVMSEISNSVGDKISSTSKIPSAAWNEISDVITGKISSFVKASSAVGDEISNVNKIPSSNVNCMADAGNTNFVGSTKSAGDAGGANDADNASRAGKLSKLYIVVGADNLAELHKWRDFSELQKLAEFVVLTRPGYEIPWQWADLRRIEIAVDASSSGFRRDFKGEIPSKIAAEVIKFYKRKDMQDPKQRAERIAEILNEKKAEDVQIIDMEGREYIAKFVVIATTLTARHAASLIEELKSVLKPLGEEFLAIESGDEWSVVDLGDIIVHLISETYRAKYNIEDFLDKLKKEQF